MPQFTIRRLSVPLLVLTLLSIVVPSATINSQAATINAVSATTPCTKPGPCYDEPQLMGGAAPAAVFNTRLAVQVGSDGRFNVGADPDPQTGGSVSGQSYDLTFAWPSSPWSSFTTVRIDGVNYTYGSSAGTFQTPPTAVDGRTISSVWQINDVDVTQTLQLVPNSQTGQEDVVKIAYTFANKGAQSRLTGARVMLDTEINYNDGAPFRVPGAGIITTETEFIGQHVPDTFQAFFGVEDSQRVAAATLESGGATPPDRLVLGQWAGLHNAPYDYTVTPGVSFTRDSAYAVYWNPTSLAPNEERTYVTFYGRSEVNADLRPPLALSVSGPAQLSPEGNRYSPNPFDIVATVLNNGTAAATDVTLTLRLPPGLSLVSGTLTQLVGDLPVNQEKQITWRVQAAAQSSQTTLSYSVIADASNAEPKQVDRQLTLPPLGTAVQVRITDTQDTPVQALTLNDEGWPSPNPLRVTVTAKNTTTAPFQNAGVTFSLTSPDNAARFVVFGFNGESDGLVCPSGFELYAPGNDYSYTRYDMTCYVDLAPGETFSIRADVWIQPSEAGQLIGSARLATRGGDVEVGSAQASVEIPLAQIHPIIFIPGITATIPPITDPSRADRLLAAGDTYANYPAFYKQLQMLGYEKDRTYFRFPWDWLTDAMVGAEALRDKLLIPASQTAATVPWIAGYTNAPAVEFDIIAHSGGNSVARAYMQGPFWRGYVRKYVSVGGTHKGLPDAYNLLEGELGGDRRSVGVLANTFTYPRAIAAGYTTPVCGLPSGCYQQYGAEERWQFAHDPFVGPTLVPQLLPTYNEANYLISKTTAAAFPFGRIANPLLELDTVKRDDYPNGAAVLDPYTNAFARRKVLDQRYPGTTFSTKFWGLNDPANIRLLGSRLGRSICTIYAGGSATADLSVRDDTRLQLRVSQPQSQTARSAPYWITGTQADVQYGRGDKTVPAVSANPQNLWDNLQYRPALDLDAIPGFAGVTVHPQMLSYAYTHERIVDCLVGMVPTFVTAAFADQSTLAEQSNHLHAQAVASEALPGDLSSSMLMLSTEGPIEMTLTDPQGRRLGFNASSAQPWSEVPFGVYELDAARNTRFLVVPAPAVGNYTLTITGIDEGVYVVHGSYFDPSGAIHLVTATGQITTGNVVTQSVAVPTQAVNVPQAPDVQAGEDATTTAGQPYTFTGSFTDINPNDTHTIHWDFGDNASATNTLTPAHTYTQPGTYTVTLTITDSSGYRDSASLVVVVDPLRGDTTPPQISIEGVTQDGTYILGAVPPASCTATDEVGGSGMRGACAGIVSGGSANGVGSYTYTATATDQASNTTTTIVTYRVIYRWDGFLQPINDTAHNTAVSTSMFNAGSTVPAKFQLKRADGTVVQAHAVVAWLTPMQGSPTTAPVDERVYTDPASDGTTYRWDSTSQQYRYNWKTSQAQAGYYWRLGVKLDDGETYYVNVGVR